MFADDVSVRSPVARDGMGKVTSWSAPTTLKARVIGQHRMVRDLAGQERVSSVRAWFPGTYSLTVEHEFTLPARFSPQTPKPISVEHYSDENGPHHEVVNFA